MSCSCSSDVGLLIIAIQGDPYTGKTTLANSLMKHLKCLVIRFDEILHIISAKEPNPPTPEKVETVITQAFDIIAQIVKTHTSFGNSVVIDSPLCRLSHLNKLVNIMENSQVRLILIQCRPKTESVWQKRFQERDISSYDRKWYKPKDNNWPLDKKFRRDYTENDIHPNVSKLVIDTTYYVPLESLFQAVTDLSTKTLE